MLNNDSALCYQSLPHILLPVRVDRHSVALAVQRLPVSFATCNAHFFDFSYDVFALTFREICLTSILFMASCATVYICPIFFVLDLDSALLCHGR